MLRYLFIFPIFFSILLASVVQVSALQIEPLIGMIHVKAGQERAGSITLTNEKDVAVTVDFLLKNFALSGSSIDHEWLTLDSDSLHIEPKQQALLSYKTSIPEEAVGEYSVRIRYHEKPKISGNESTLSIKTAVSVPFYALVSGTEDYNCKILDFQMNHELANEAVIIFGNAGNAHVRPSGHCWIKKIDSDQILCSAQLNSGNSPVYPDKERTFKIQFDEVLPLGKYVAELQFSLFANADESNRASFEFEVVRKPTL